MRCENSVCMVADAASYSMQSLDMQGLNTKKGGAGVDGAIVHGLM